MDKASGWDESKNQEEFEFVPDTNRWVEVIQGETELIGKLDSAGNFVPDRRYFFRKGQGTSGVPVAVMINGAPLKSIYEFRSGRLILGDMDEAGNFIPRVGEKVIDFKDYRYDPKGSKIYNLPGKFVRKGEKEEKK